MSPPFCSPPYPSPFCFPLVHTDTPSWCLLGIAMATLQQNDPNTFMLTVVQDEVLIPSEAGAAGRMLKSRALCQGPCCEVEWEPAGAGVRARRKNYPEKPCDSLAGDVMCVASPPQTLFALYTYNTTTMAGPDMPNITVWNRHHLIQCTETRHSCQGHCEVGWQDSQLSPAFSWLRSGLGRQSAMGEGLSCSLTT